MQSSLTLTTRQGLQLTPQLQQSLQLLQYSNNQLLDVIQQQLESNPLLDTDDHETTVTAEQHDSLTPTTTLSGSREGDADQWQEHTCDSQSLHDHLHWQLAISDFSATENAIALVIIDAIDDDGLLSQSLEQLQINLPKVGLTLLQAVLQKVQQFEPTGVAANDISECLQLQLDAFAADTPGWQTAEQIIAQHLTALGQQQFDVLKTACDVNEASLQQAIDLIKQLDPRPGSRFSNNRIEYVVPELQVEKHQEQWRVSFNEATLPTLRINQAYTTIVTTQHDQRYVSDQLQQAKWLLQGLQQRQNTLLQVARAIMQQQQNFLNHGSDAIKPLVLHDIADMLDIHESTVSRAVSHKYILTPHGIFALKYFFSSKVASSDGQQVAATAIQSAMQSLIGQENPAKPLSDSKLVALLAQQQIQVARRTVSKYRDILKIAPSHERKLPIGNNTSAG